ncbi:hypothetical protein [Amycolatopsis keratiniphila]|uniref:hypothetical protein n=1 Tax=Amycolatopsis keratiniphila TaxID=129921 RepID=UPI00087DEDF4|nr:hypothetical protein [Amycolatopsis keratiniphila]OLZ43887.1 hypothetical protein BS330_41280 [Amycolatopsis keratiniphila subsp. nogabecina]SDU71474.1 hypothetical protein SAMN04489733_8920 [Amycolatopsis keratiniphila]
MIRRLAVLSAAAMLLSGCALFVPEKRQAPAPTAAMTTVGPVADAVRTARPEFLQVEVGENRDGLTTGVVVDAEVPFGYVVTGEVLRTVLVSVWKASDPKPAFVKFNPWSTYEGRKGAIKAQRAAEELGIDWSPSLAVGVHVPDYEIKKLAGG